MHVIPIKKFSFATQILAIEDPLLSFGRGSCTAPQSITFPFISYVSSDKGTQARRARWWPGMARLCLTEARST